MKKSTKVVFATLLLFVGVLLFVPPSQAYSKRVENVEHVEHLDFVAAKLQLAVEDGSITMKQKNKILVSFRRLMKSQPTSTAFVAMSAAKKQQTINRWKNQASSALKGSGVTLEQVRDITGKGNKYLMGIQF